MTLVSINDKEKETLTGIGNKIVQFSQPGHQDIVMQLNYKEYMMLLSLIRNLSKESK